MKGRSRTSCRAIPGHRHCTTVTERSRMPYISFSNKDLQNAFFEGYLQDLEVTKLHKWEFHGIIVHAAVNYPGSGHDNRLTTQSGLYWPLLINVNTHPIVAVLGSSAFVKNISATTGKLLRGLRCSEVS